MRDTDFVRELYDAAYARLVGQLTGVTGSLTEAEDVVQEAFARAISHAGRVRRTSNPEAWLRRVAVNRARSRWRRVQHLARLTPRLAPDARPREEDALGPERMTLLAALRRLPAAQREALGLHYFADLPVHEIARTLDVPTGTVKARLSRGRHALAGLLAEDGSTTSASEAPHA